jgi:hypothetical protein
MVVYVIQCVRLKYKYIEYQIPSINVNLTVICIPLKSHQSNQTRSTTLRNFIDCEYSSYLFFFNTMTYNTCIHVCIVYVG